MGGDVAVGVADVVSDTGCGLRVDGGADRQARSVVSPKWQGVHSVQCLLEAAQRLWTATNAVQTAPQRWQ